MLGGGMRQAGIIAAAGIVAIEKMVDRLKDDHANAKRLATGLANLGYGIDASKVQTNIVICGVSAVGMNSREWISKMSDHGVKTGAVDAGRVRMVTHRGIEKEDIDLAINAAKKVIKQA